MNREGKSESTYGSIEAVKVTKASLSKLTKAQIEEKGREFGIEVDRRKKKDDLV